MDAQTEGGQAFTELNMLVDQQVRSNIRWYQSRKRVARRLHRLSTSTVVAAGAAIPLLAGLRQGGANLLSGALGVLIAALTGLGAVFKWDEAWAAFSKAQFELEELLVAWELSVVAIRSEGPSEQETRERILAATEQLLVSARAIRKVETDGFFGKILRSEMER